MAGVYFAFSVSVNLGLAAQPDATYVATMNAINDRIENPLFFLSFFGAAVLPLAMLGSYYRRPRSGRFWLVALASRTGQRTLHRGQLSADILRERAHEHPAR
jgi:uncharacterized membrane protein